MAENTHKTVPCLKVHQWLKEWDEVEFVPEFFRRKPEPFFYVFTLPAVQLKLLSGINRRSLESHHSRGMDLGIQRRHELARSKEIGRFVQFGYPWSDLPVAKQKSGQFNDLRKPGWLPTAIVLNILKLTDVRPGNQKVAKNDIIEINDHQNRCAEIILPKGFPSPNWTPSERHPIEVIDGQHRLWAFEEGAPANFELPVVAFHGLDISWQAYLFWTINIKPKRINPSLAFDLYPLLRSEDWLEKFEGHSIYRETRAQELTEIMWSHEESPWYHRINMLGDPGSGSVTQAAWVRSLLATYVRAFEGGRTRKGKLRIGGLFGAPVREDRLVLPWSRAQQAAFLIAVWSCLKDCLAGARPKWAQDLRAISAQKDLFDSADLAFGGPYTLLNQDQGVRSVLHVTNDLCFVSYEQLELGDWVVKQEVNTTEPGEVTKALRSLEKTRIFKFLEEMASQLASFDWRTANTPTLTDDERTAKLVFRGSGGYTEFRKQLLKHLIKKTGEVGKAARKVFRETKDA
jgi:DGQHR domain-containing protein